MRPSVTGRHGPLGGQRLTIDKKTLTHREWGNLSRRHDPRSHARMYSAFYRRTFAIATFLIVGYLLLEVLRPLAGPLGWAAVLAFLLTPVQVRLKRRLKGRGSLSAGILTGLTPFFVIAPLAIVGIVFARQVASLIMWLRGRTVLPFPAILERMESYPVIGGPVHWMRENS